ncbi:MAG: hypothetical protein ACO1SX_23935 [Actinomycetota bacterium]
MGMICIAGHDVYVRTGPKTRTYNVRSLPGSPNRYKHRVQLEVALCGSYPPDRELVAHDFPTIDAFAAHLINHHQGYVPTIGRSPRLPNCVSVIADPDWMGRAVTAVEQSINRLLDQFLTNWYMHRVEHSIHCELYTMFKETPPLNRIIDFGTFVTQPVHKEWPETCVRPGKNERGEYDFGILPLPSSGSPAVSEALFCEGWIAPAIAIELGLNYNLKHLASDAAKLEHGGIKRGYLVHLAQPTCGYQPGVEECVRKLIVAEKLNGPRIGYAHVFRDRMVFRRLGEPDITSIHR